MAGEGACGQATRGGRAGSILAANSACIPTAVFLRSPSATLSLGLHIHLSRVQFTSPTCHTLRPGPAPELCPAQTLLDSQLTGGRLEAEKCGLGVGLVTCEAQAPLEFGQPSPRTLSPCFFHPSICP